MEHVTAIVTVTGWIIGVGGITSAIVVYLRFRTAFDGLGILKTANEAYLAALTQAQKDILELKAKHQKEVGYLQGQIDVLQSSIVDRLVMRLEETLGNAIKEAYKTGRKEERA